MWRSQSCAQCLLGSAWIVCQQRERKRNRKCMQVLAHAYTWPSNDDQFESNLHLGMYLGISTLCFGILTGFSRTQTVFQTSYFHWCSTHIVFSPNFNMVVSNCEIPNFQVPNFKLPLAYTNISLPTNAVMPLPSRHQYDVSWGCEVSIVPRLFFFGPTK